jgi:transcriptional regulator with XRE-family HTH domain
MSRRIVVRFGRRIRELRDARNMNQTALAERIGTKQETISRIENGRQETCLNLIDELADALRVSLSELFKGL